MARDRRTMLLALLGGVTAACSRGVADSGAALDALEAGFHGRLGVFGLDTGSGAVITHRAAERFPLCSTVKMLVGSAAVTEFARSIGDQLSRVDRYEPQLSDVPPGDQRDTSTSARWSGHPGAYH